MGRNPPRPYPFPHAKSFPVSTPFFRHHHSQPTRDPPHEDPFFPSLASAGERVREGGSPAALHVLVVRDAYSMPCSRLHLTESLAWPMLAVLVIVERRSAIILSRGAPCVSMATHRA
jgi:hypothetical protein